MTSLNNCFRHPLVCSMKGNILDIFLVGGQIVASSRKKESIERKKKGARLFIFVAVKKEKR